MKFSAYLALALTTALWVPAVTAADETAGVTQPTAPETPKKVKKTCYREQISGSNRIKRVCYTQADEAVRSDAGKTDGGAQITSPGAGGN